MQKIYLKTIRDVQKSLCRIIADVRSRTLRPSEANSMIYGLNNLMRTMQASDFEERLTDLERIASTFTERKPVNEEQKTQIKAITNGG